MANRKPLTDEEGEVRELTEEDLKHFVPFSDFPESLQAKLRTLKKPFAPLKPGPKTSTKETVTIQLSVDLVEKLCTTGPGWQKRVDTALRQWI